MAVTRDSIPRVRLTTRDPFKGAYIGPTVWVGSVNRGWIGKPLNPRKWYLTWRVTSA